MAITVSLVHYLNAAPLGWGFTHGPLQKDVSVQYSTPAQCAVQLSEGQVDAGLIPAAEYQCIPGLRLVPGISIATRGKARDALLISRVPAPEIHTLALDNCSRTSAVLVQLLLAEAFDVHPEISNRDPDLKDMLSRDDAALVIGDPALSISREGVYIYDLGEMWVRRTGLPFVFAFWAVRPGVDAAAVISLFEQSKSCGIGHLNEICRQYALRIPLSIDEIYDYLRVSLDFELGKQHQLSLQLFYEKAYRCGLLPSMRPLEFLNI